MVGLDDGTADGSLEGDTLGSMGGARLRLDDGVTIGSMLDIIPGVELGITL